MRTCLTSLRHRQRTYEVALFEEARKRGSRGEMKGQRPEQTLDISRNKHSRDTQTPRRQQRRQRIIKSAIVYLILHLARLHREQITRQNLVPSRRPLHPH